MAHPLISPSGAWMRDVLSDEDVVRRVLAGERELFELIVRRHNQRLFRTIRAIVGNAERAEEALQRTYIRGWRRLATYSGEGPLIAWLSAIAVREARHVLRGERRELERVGEAPAGDRRAGIAPSALEAVAGNELQARVDAAVLALPESYRSVLVLRAVEKLPTAEVAATLDLSESTVKVRLHRARAMLREGLGVDERVGHMDAVWAFDGERCDRIVVGVMRRVAGSP